jgi:hypothetical protein
MRSSHRLMKRQAAVIRELTRELERDLAHCDGRLEAASPADTPLEFVTARYLQYVQVCGFLGATMRGVRGTLEDLAVELEAAVADEERDQTTAMCCNPDCEYDGCDGECLEDSKR